MYRRLGNRLGTKTRIRQGLPRYYMIRAVWLLRMIEEFDVLSQGDRVLEVGTGWLHWEALVVRLFYDVEVTLFDVWDSRQLEPLKRYCGELVAQIDTEMALSPRQRARLNELLDAIAPVRSFDQLYRLLGFRYVIEPAGTLHPFTDESFDAIVSGNVLQHVDRCILPGYIRDFGRLLKPGGFSLHTIDMGDQLSYYDAGTSVKNYLRFSDRTWKLLFENRVQYFNRVQRGQWLDLFDTAGLELLAEQVVSEQTHPIKVSAQYRHLSRQDLECRVIRVVHRKRFRAQPEPGGSPLGVVAEGGSGG
jgi:cyclopropane fatty-acyl-phospholipid synthase-like methyltransferase